MSRNGLRCNNGLQIYHIFRITIYHNSNIQIIYSRKSNIPWLSINFCTFHLLMNIIIIYKSYKQLSNNERYSFHIYLFIENCIINCVECLQIYQSVFSSKVSSNKFGCRPWMLWYHILSWKSRLKKPENCFPNPVVVHKVNFLSFHSFPWTHV